MVHYPEDVTVALRKGHLNQIHLETATYFFWQNHVQWLFSSLHLYSVCSALEHKCKVVFENIVIIQ